MFSTSEHHFSRERPGATIVFGDVLKTQTGTINTVEATEHDHRNKDGSASGCAERDAGSCLGRSCDLWGRSTGVQNEDYTSAMWKLNVYICVFECSDAVSDCFIPAPSSFSAYPTGLAIPATSPALTRCSPAMSAFLIGPLCHCYISAAVKPESKSASPASGWSASSFRSH